MYSRFNVVCDILIFFELYATLNEQRLNTITRQQHKIKRKAFRRNRLIMKINKENQDMPPELKKSFEHSSSSPFLNYMRKNEKALS